MYALIIVIGVLSPANSSAIGVTSQTVGKFENLEQCKAVATQPLAGGTISDLGISKGNLLVLRIHRRQSDFTELTPSDLCRTTAARTFNAEMLEIGEEA